MAEPIKSAVIDGKRFYHISEAARMAGVSERTLYRRIKQGRVKGRVFGRSWYVTEHEARKVVKYEQGK